MKKSTMGVTIALLILIVGVVATYAILTGKAKTETEESLMTAVQTALNRDLAKDYPATVKEVVKYYTELEKCIYNEEYTDQEQEALFMQARELYDEDLKSINEVGIYLQKMKQEVQEFRDAKRRINSIAVSASTNVDYFDEDGYEFARIYCGYSVLDNKKSVLEGRVYLLRRDAEKHWRIYGWANANDVNPQ